MCTTFAWFTSKDEVTNRLSANADYDVKIVESFAPPENWLPGQEVNKDVYAVNTGNVAAFVEETVSGTLTITTEVTKDDISANSVKLTAAERYLIEDGSYLAFAPAGSNLETGRMIVAMNPDREDLDGYTTANQATDFAPDAADFYVFRRYIDIDPSTKIEKFEYAAYYYDGHDFYKVTDLSVEPGGLYEAGNILTNDGKLTNATAKFVEEETKIVTPTLAYDAVNNRLVATYETGEDVTDTQLEQLAAAYDDALVAYEVAVAKYNAALRSDTTADGNAQTANNNLQSAYNDLLAKQKELVEKQKDLAAKQAEKARTAAALQVAQTAKDEADAAVTAAQAADDQAATAVSVAQTALTTAEGNVTTAQGDVTAAQGVVDGYNGTTPKSAFETYMATYHSEVNLNDCSYAELTAIANLDNDVVNYEYYEKLVALKKAQDDLKTAQTAENVKRNELAAAQQRKQETEAALAQAQQAATQAGTALSNAQDADNAAQDAVDAAQSTYNDAVNTAGGASNDVITAANALADAQRDLDAAKKAFEKAYNSSNDGKLKININLADVITTGATADKWLLLPSADPLGTEADFYYTSVLGAGKTSAQLIDSVELDKSVTNDMFKRFEFDLNVNLESVQVTYDEDNNILATAANEEFDGVKVTNVDQSTQAVTWAQTTPATPTYKVNDTEVSVTTFTSSAPDLADYKYKVTVAEGAIEGVEAGTYVGKSDTGTFYKLNSNATGVTTTSITISKE